jgi:hypothetical protein
VGSAQPALFPLLLQLQQKQQLHLQPLLQVLRLVPPVIPTCTIKGCTAVPLPSWQAGPAAVNTSLVPTAASAQMPPLVHAHPAVLMPVMGERSVLPITWRMGHAVAQLSSVLVIAFAQTIHHRVVLLQQLPLPLPPQQL